MNLLRLCLDRRRETALKNFILFRSPVLDCGVLDVAVRPRFVEQRGRRFFWAIPHAASGNTPRIQC